MLSARDVPHGIEESYRRYKDISRKIYQVLEKLARQQRLPSNQDLLQVVGHDKFAFIREGYFKLQHNGKAVRLYSEGDFIASDPTFNEYRLSSEFGCEISLFDRATLLKAVSANPEIQDAWTRLWLMENSINLSLCAHLMTEDIEADFGFKQFNTGDTIIEQGDVPRAIYEMTSGEAVVLKDGVEVGRVNVGEIFGEVGFLTGGTRSATVEATSDCFVRVVNQHDFLALIERNPHLIISISKTLAKRLVELNAKLAAP
jgi:CRP/FNR family cyclic AMP-dependent transcriptional regulator